MNCDICNQPLPPKKHGGKQRKRHDECRGEFNRRRLEEVRILDATDDPVWLAMHVAELRKRLRNAKRRLEAVKGRSGKQNSATGQAAASGAILEGQR